MTNYTEQDTERARQAERSSAGQETQNLGLPGGMGQIQLPAAPRGQSANLGLALLGIGVAWLLFQTFTLPLNIVPGMILLTIAACFYFFGFWQRIYPLLIPANILAGLSVGVTFVTATRGVSVLWGLALGFLGIYVLGMALFRQRNPWPVIPATILFAVGLIVAIVNLPAFLSAGLIWVPLLLIAAGLYMGFFRR